MNVPLRPARPETQGSETWTNWVGNQSFRPKRLARPAGEDEVQALVRDAAAAGENVRVVGAGHSFSPIIETEVLVCLDAMRGVIDVDRDTQQFSAWAATRVSELGDVLWNEGLALANQGDIDTQALVGAVSTGTHGSGLLFKTFSAGLRGATLIDGRGNRLQVSDRENAELLPALQCSIGLLGPMTRLRMQAALAYTIEEDVRTLPFGEVMERWDEFQADYRHFSFFWMPTDRSAELYGMAGTPRDHCVVKLYRELPADTPPVGGPKRTDRSYRIYPSVYDPNFHEMEYFMPVGAAREVVEAQRRTMLSGRFDSRFPLEVRFVAADETWISPAAGRDSVVLSISGVPGTPYEDYLRNADALFAEHAGRPHWGKLHYLTRDRAERVFPRFGDFVDLRRRLDPRDMFLNGPLAPLFA